MNTFIDVTDNLDYRVQQLKYKYADPMTAYRADSDVEAAEAWLKESGHDE